MIENQQILDWVIYKITNPNGKVYIGKSSNWINRYRNYKYFKTAKQVHKQRILYSSLLKYGFEAHKVEVIERFKSDSNYCSGKEMFWIRSYMSNVCRYPEMSGMNLTDGGEGNLGWKRPRYSVEEIRQKNKGKKRSQEFKDSMSQKMKGNKNGCGRVLSEKHKEIIRQARINSKGDINFKKTCKSRAARMNKEAGKSIVYLDEKGNILKEFDFIYEVGFFFNVTEHTVRRYMKGIGVPKKLNAILKYRKDI